MRCSRFAPGTNDNTTGTFGLSAGFGDVDSVRTMQDHSSPSPAVVVGIDGSRSAIDAALWAVDEAVSRDVPLRLIYAIDPACADTDPRDAARDLARAEVAVRHAFTEVEATDKPVKIEVEILQEPPTRALLTAARSAALLCVGAMGLKHCSQGRIGSTAAAVASSTHCPVAIVRGHDPIRTQHQWVVAEVDATTGSDGVLRRALEEARLRNVPLRVLTAWQSRYTDIHDGNAVADGNRLARAQLDRRLAQWKKRYPDVDMHTAAVNGNTLNFLAKNASSIQLLVVGHERREGVAALVGPPGLAALQNAECSVLICERQNVL